MRTAFKFVAADFTTRGHTFTWPFPGGELRCDPDSVNTDNKGPCPSGEGDGLCLAKTVRGACSGGQPMSTAVGLRVEYDPADVLGEDNDKLRVSACRVTGVFDPMHLLRTNAHVPVLGADLEGANLRGANLRGANLRGADANDYTVWPDGFTVPESVVMT